MAQRVACARAFALEAPVLLCDEPFAALDYNTLIEMETLFWTQVRRRQTSCLFVTHQLDSALGVSDRILVLASHPMRVDQEIRLHEDFQKLNPLERRESAIFANYFTQLWNGLSRAKSVACQ
jgi:NitT/TauT family transport system ATP-binding protein